MIRAAMSPIATRAQRRTDGVSGGVAGSVACFWMCGMVHGGFPGSGVSRDGEAKSDAGQRPVHDPSRGPAGRALDSESTVTRGDFPGAAWTAWTFTAHAPTRSLRAPRSAQHHQGSPNSDWLYAVRFAGPLPRARDPCNPRGSGEPVRHELRRPVRRSPLATCAWSMLRVGTRLTESRSPTWGMWPWSGRGRPGGGSVWWRLLYGRR